MPNRTYLDPRAADVETVTAPDTRSDARKAFDTAHGKASALVMSAKNGHPADLAVLTANVEEAIATYATLTAEELRDLSQPVRDLIADVSEFGIKPPKPRVQLVGPANPALV